MRLRAATVMAAIAALVAIAAPPALAAGPPGTAARPWPPWTAVRPDPLHHRRDPAHPRPRLDQPRVRLRLRLRQGQPVHDGERLRHGRGPAVPVLRADRRGYIQRGNGVVVSNLDSDLFFQQIIDSGVVQHLAQAPQPDREAGWKPATSRATTPTSRTSAARRGVPGPDLPRPGLGEADHAAGQLPALLPAHAAGQQRRRHRRASPRPRRRRPGRPPAASPPPARPGPRGRSPPRGGRSPQHGQQRGRDRVRGHQGPPRPAARQPALPVDRPGALLPGAAHHPRQDQRHRRLAVRRAADPHRPQRVGGVEPHRVDRVPVHPVPAHPGDAATRRSTCKTARPWP